MHNITTLNNQLPVLPRKESKTVPISTQQQKILEACLETFSKLSKLQQGEIFTYHHGKFHSHKNTLWNRFIFAFRSKNLRLIALDSLVSECAKTIELLRMQVNPLDTDYSEQLEAERSLLQKIHSQLASARILGLENLKTCWNDQEHIDKINAVQSKIAVLDHSIVSLNNFITRFKVNAQKPISTDQLIQKCTSDNYVDIFISNFLQKKSPEENHPNYFSTQTVQNSLMRYFGKSATLKIFNMYQMTDVHFISSVDLKALIIGIAANLTMEDLNTIYHSEIKTPLNDYLPLNKPKEPGVEFLKKIREVSFFSGGEYRKFKISKPPYLHQLRKDQFFLKRCLKLNLLNLAEAKVKTASLQHFAYTEYLARDIAYGLYPLDEYATCTDGTLVPVPDENGQPILMEAHTLQNKRGLYGVVLIPAQLDSKSCPKTIPVQILFRGSRNFAAWNRNLSPLDKIRLNELEGPGARSFANSKTKLLQNLEIILQKLPKDSSVKLDITGHSLGACDGQRMCEAFASKICQDKNSSFHNLDIKEVNFFGFNTPGIDINTNTSFLHCAALLPQIKFQLRYFKAKHDVVQTVANFVLGYHPLENLLPPNVLTSVFKFTKPESALGNNPANRYALVPHSQFNLHAYEDLAKTIPNDVWITHIITNNPADTGIVYQGKNADDPTKQSILDFDAARRSLFHQKWLSTLRRKFIRLIRG
jgi:hypothetical protein